MRSYVTGTKIFAFLAHFYRCTNYVKIKKMMQDIKEPRNSPVPNAENDINKQQSKSLSEAKNDPSVKAALKKENSPSTPEDLSNLHNNKAIGTSGGDQRASDDEQKTDE